MRIKNKNLKGLTSEVAAKIAMTATAVKISDLVLPKGNPRTIKDANFQALCKSVEGDPEFLRARPVIASDRTGKLVVVAGFQRVMAARFLKMDTVPTIVVTLTEAKEKVWSLKDNLHQGEWNYSLLADGFDEAFLKSVGFESEMLDEIYAIDEDPEVFDLAKELKKLDIKKIETKHGDCYEITPNFRLMNGDSTIEADVLKLMNGEKADMCCVDEPYILDYTKGKKRSKATEGFGYKRDRKYLGTDTLPPDFMSRWLENLHKVQKDDFSIISFENWKNLKQMWEEMEKFWKIRNVIIWHVPNRVQGFAAKYKFFDKFDISVVGTSGNVNLNTAPEEELFQNEFEAALFATSGKPHWEPYAKGKKYCPTDFIQHVADDEKHSGQGIVFGCKPISILIPYLKVLTKRGDLVVDFFGGSGSTAAAAIMLGRRCYMMEKSPVYCEVIKRRIERLTGAKAIKIHD